MPSNKPRFTIRTDQETLIKIARIAQEHQRSATQEIVHIIKKHIDEYEEEKGPIDVQRILDSIKTEH